MGRIEKRIFFGVLLVLLSALGAMLFQNAFATDAPRIYRVSVLLDGAGLLLLSLLGTGLILLSVSALTVFSVACLMIAEKLAERRRILQ